MAIETSHNFQFSLTVEVNFPRNSIIKTCINKNHLKLVDTQSPKKAKISCMPNL